jgi:hypothetical protein
LESEISFDRGFCFEQRLDEPASGEVIDDEIGQPVSWPVNQPERIRLLAIDHLPLLNCSQDLCTWKHNGMRVCHWRSFTSS